MARIDELIQRLCPDGVEYKPLGEVGAFLRGSGFQKKHFTDRGTPCIHYGQLYTHYGLSARSTLSFLDPEFAKGKKGAKAGDLVIATTSENVEDVGKACAWLGENDIVVSNDAFVFRHSLEPMFASHLFASALFQEQKMRFITGAKVHRISGDSMAKIIVPVPPLEVQQEIVRILDAFTELEANLQRELDARKRQYEHYRDELLSFGDGVERVPLGDIGQFSMCKRVMKDQTSPEGEVPFYKIGTFGGEPDAYISRSLFEEYRGRYPYPNKGDLLMSCSGTLGRIVEFDGEDAYFQDSNIAWIANDETRVSNRFLKHWYSTDPWPAPKGGTIGRLYGADVKKMAVPVPLPEVQQDIATKLDAMVALQDNLRRQIELTHRQYEHYRDQLLDLPRKEA